jgi:hypothetical protein
MSIDALFGLGARQELSDRLRVDDVYTYQTIGAAIGLGVRLGVLTAQDSVKHSDLCAGGDAAALDLVARVLDRLATDVRQRQQRLVGGEVTSIISPLTPGLDAWMDYQLKTTANQLGVVAYSDPTLPEDNLEIRSGEQTVRIINIGDGAPRLVSRFAAVAAEIEEDP